MVAEADGGPASADGLLYANQTPQVISCTKATYSAMFVSFPTFIF